MRSDEVDVPRVVNPVLRRSLRTHLPRVLVLSLNVP